MSVSSAEDLELSVLILADHYWEVVSGKTERLSESLAAIETVFGWRVQGSIPMSSVSGASCMKIGIN